MLGVTAKTLSVSLFPNKWPSYRVGNELHLYLLLDWPDKGHATYSAILGREHALMLEARAAFWVMADVCSPL